MFAGILSYPVFKRDYAADETLDPSELYAVYIKSHTKLIELSSGNATEISDFFASLCN